MVNNARWLDRLEHLPFLARIGRHFSINRMLTMEQVRARLDRQQSLSFLEFSYMILQAYDFLELARRHDCGLQMGGSDQWGNIVNGIELARRADGRRLFGLVTPLIVTADGSKMGKTAAGAVWLDAERLAPDAFWQFWRNTRDEDVVRFLALFTDLPPAEIERLEGLRGEQINEAKIVLANEATRLAHGADAAMAAEAAAARAFGPAEAALAERVLKLELSRLQSGVELAELLVLAGLARSKSAARREILAGTVRWKGATVSDPHKRVQAAELDDSDHAQLGIGRRRIVTIKVA